MTETLEDYVNHPIFIRSDLLLQRKKRIIHFPEKEGAWDTFRFIYENFKELRTIKKQIERKNLLPTENEARDYLQIRFPNDLHLKKMTSKQLITTHTYIIMYESIIPFSYESSLIDKTVISNYSFYPATKR